MKARQDLSHLSVWGHSIIYREILNGTPQLRRSFGADTLCSISRQEARRVRPEHMVLLLSSHRL